MTDRQPQTGYLNGVCEALEEFASFTCGNPYAQVVCCTTGTLPIAPAVEEAISKAIVAMGYADEGCFYMDVGESGGATAEQVALCMETVDPLIVIGLDRGCADVLGRLAGIGSAVVGERFEHRGRPCVVLDDFPAALFDADEKRAAWHQMRRLARSTLSFR